MTTKLMGAAFLLGMLLMLGGLILFVLRVAGVSEALAPTWLIFPGITLIFLAKFPSLLSKGASNEG